MSELGVLSHRYDKSVHFTEIINESVLTIKMKFHNIAGKEKITSSQLNNSKEALIAIIDDIIFNLDQNKASDYQRKTSVSQNMIKRLYVVKRGSLNFYLDDLRNLRKHLSDITELNEKDMELLDELCKLGDNESSMIFRKLWLE